MNPTPRLMFHLLCDGYVINYTNGITSLLIPFEDVRVNYNEFIIKLEEYAKSKRRIA